MATVYGVNATKYQDPKPDNIVDASQVHGSVRFFYDEYTAAALPDGDVIKVGPVLPAGAMVLNIVVQHADLGTGLTMDIGDSHDVDRYLDGIDTATAAAKSSMDTSSVTLGPIGGRGYVIGTNSGDNQIQLTNIGGAATGLIKVYCTYAVRG